MKNEWKFVSEKSESGFRHDYYTLNGWKVWSDGFNWLIKNPSGHKYAQSYKTLANAKSFAEKRMK